MVELAEFPALNATLNGISGCCLLAGYFMIRAGWCRGHGICMSIAGAVSIVFLGRLRARGDFRIVVGTGDRVPRPPPSLGIASPHGAMDAADLAVRLGYWRDYLFHALSLVWVGKSWS